MKNASKSNYPKMREILLNTKRDTDIWELVDFPTIVGTLAAAYGALWLLFGG